MISGTSNIMDSYLLDITRGVIPGQKSLDKFGRTQVLPSGTLTEDVWNGGGIYTGFPTTGTAQTLEIVRSNTGDVGDLQIFGLDRDYNEIQETVNLTGTGTHLTTQSFWRANRAIWRGSSDMAGDITIRHSTTTANIFAVMPADVNQTAIACTTIPAGYTGYLKSLNIRMTRANGQSASAEVGFKIRETDGTTFQVFRNIRPEAITTSQSYSFNSNNFLTIKEKSDIKVSVLFTSDTGTKFSADFDLILIKN
jgi:hypothetical protein